MNSGEGLPLIRQLDLQNPSKEILQKASRLLHEGKLVAFPTETVYGLGANALNPMACRKIFEAKGRPSNNPLIVHVADIKGARDIGHWTEEAQVLARNFWPGPLTLVLPRKSQIPDEVTAGGGTVAIRVPNHPVALALLQTSGLPLAAPSANRSNAVSPTRAFHVVQSLGEKVDMVLDGGICQVGIESTVLDLTTRQFEILRPGQLTRQDLEKVLGQPVSFKEKGLEKGIFRSPGQLGKHYSPKTPIEILGSLGDARERCLFWQKQNKKVLLIAGEMGEGVVNWGNQSHVWARNLYEAFHNWDQQGWDRVLIVPPIWGDEGAGVLDRLARAADLA